MTTDSIELQSHLHSSHRVSHRTEIGVFVPAFILAGYGIFVLSLFVRGVMTWYISPLYVLPTTLAGGVLVGLAVVEGWRRSRGAVADSCGDDCACGTDAPLRWRSYAVLLIPLLLALIFPPRGLAAFSATMRGPQIAGLSSVRGVSAVSRVSLSVDTARFSMMDWVGALSADPNPRDYMGKPVVVTGIVLHDPASVPPGYFMVLRYLVWCCIADARPVGLIVKDTPGAAVHDNEWVQVTGKMGAAKYQGQSMAVVEPRTVTPTKAGDEYIN